MTVLCATDFSPCSEAATDLAAVVAHRLSDSLCLLHVVEMPSLGLPEIPMGASPWEGQMKATAQARFALIANELSRTGLKVETRVVAGSASEVVLDVARALTPRLIVVGTHGRKGPAQFFLGSVAEQIVHEAPCPVLVTRAGVDLGRWKRPEPLRLAIAADGSRSVKQAFSWGANFARQIPGELTVVRLYWPPEEGRRYGIEHAWLGDRGHPDLVRLLARDLEGELPPRSEAEGPRVRFRAVERHAAEALVAEAADLQADVLVVGASKRHAPAHGISVSAAEVMRAASVPVVCVPTPSEPTAKSIERVRSILIATDLTATSLGAIAPAYGLLANGGGRVELCYVNVQERTDDLLDVSLPPPLTDAERVEVESKLRALVPPDAAALGIATNILVLDGLSAERTLLQAAERLNIDLIALASHGRAGIKRVVLGSIAEEVARRSFKPVLIIHAREPDRPTVAPKATRSG